MRKAISDCFAFDRLKWRSRFQAMLAIGAFGLVAIVAINLPVNPVRRETPWTREISRGPTGYHRVAITFDAGGEITDLPKLLGALEVARVHSTFFLTGIWATQHLELVRDICRRGHEVGNHTWSHSDLTEMDYLGVRSEIMRADALLATLIGHSPRPWFRAPFGARNSRILRIADELGYTSVYWTIDSLDSDAPVKSPAFLIARVTERSDAALDGAILLMHVGEPATAAAVPAILANLQRRGFKMVTISELLRVP